MLNVILLFGGGALAGLLIYAATRPDHFKIVRSAVVPAAPAAVFAQINDLQRWQGWSPWEGLDPALKRSYSGPPAGVGAAYGWQGNTKAGEGRMEIVESVPDQTIVFKLDFLKPFEAHNRVTFTLVPVAAGTQVTWAMDGPQNFMAKLMGALLNIDRMVGRDFEKGLARLSEVVKTAA
ncbi:MAG: SRPBCC family protein [Beijerinckiaceae bacterium]